MKRYKPLLMQVGILLLVFSVVFFLLEQRKHFINIDFSKYYSQNKTIELAGFEEGERWQGNFSYDSQRVMEGKSSITFSSWYGKENTIINNQDTMIPPGYIKGYLNVYITDNQTLSSLVSFSLRLFGERDQKKEYPLLPLHVGWNRVAVTIPDWKKITSKSFTALSKPGTIAEINLDRFWIENTSAYTSDIFSTKSKSLSLRTIGERTYLFATSSLLEQYVVNTPSSIRKGTITISLIPEHAKEALLSLNNTSMKIVEKNVDECILYKNGKTSTTKVLKKTSGKDNQYLFLKAEVHGGTIAYSLSNNGIDFESCGTVASSQITAPELLLRGSYLIDSYSAEY